MQALCALFPAFVLIAIGLLMLFKHYWPSGSGSNLSNLPTSDGICLTPEPLAPPAATSAPDVTDLDYNALKIRLNILLTGNGADPRQKSLGGDGVFHTRNGAHFTVFHGDERACVVIMFGRDEAWRVVHGLNELYVLYADADVAGCVISTWPSRNTGIDGLTDMPTNKLRVLVEILSVAYAVGYLQ